MSNWLWNKGREYYQISDKIFTKAQVTEAEKRYKKFVRNRVKR